MKLREMIEFIKQHHPEMSEGEMIMLLNEAMDDFSEDTRIVEWSYTFDTVIDKRYYNLHDDIIEITDVNYDTGNTVIAYMSDTDTTGGSGSHYQFTLTSDHGLVAGNIGDTVELNNFTTLTQLNGVTTKLRSLSTNTITLEGIISNGTQETAATATFTFPSTGTSGGKRIPRLIGIPDERDIG